MYGDECPRSRDIDALERQVSDLDYDIRQVDRRVDDEASDRRDAVRDVAGDLREVLRELREDLDRAFDRIAALEAEKNDTESKSDLP